MKTWFVDELTSFLDCISNAHDIVNHEKMKLIYDDLGFDIDSMPVSEYVNLGKFTTCYTFFLKDYYLAHVMSRRLVVCSLTLVHSVTLFLFVNEFIIFKGVIHSLLKTWKTS